MRPSSSSSRPDTSTQEYQSLRPTSRDEERPLSASRTSTANSRPTSSSSTRSRPKTPNSPILEQKAVSIPSQIIEALKIEYIKNREFFLTLKP